MIELDYELAAIAGKTGCEMKKKSKGWGLVDSFVLYTARNLNGRVVTVDEHFRSFQDIMFMK